MPKVRLRLKAICFSNRLFCFICFVSVLYFPAFLPGAETGNPGGKDCLSCHQGIESISKTMILSVPPATSNLKTEKGRPCERDIPKLFEIRRIPPRWRFSVCPATRKRSTGSGTPSMVPWPGSSIRHDIYGAPRTELRPLFMVSAVLSSRCPCRTFPYLPIPLPC